MQDKEIDYSKTLNLPKTDFSMKADLVNKEPALLKKWEGDKLYEKIKSASKGRKQFILHDGPPYANGHIHIGHALNKILKDMIVKFRFMEGYDSFYIPGWDCHGLPIEHQLLKDLNKRKSEVDCVQFRKQAHDYAMKFVGIQREEFKRLGVFGEWHDPYLTLAPQYEYWILKSLGRLNQKGYVYRGEKPVNWCFQCETALAEAEVEYENHVSPSVYVKFPVNNPEILKDVPQKKISLLIWTTTPWTLLANVAVAVSTQFHYVLVDIGSEVLIMEQSLHERVLGKAGIADFKVIKSVKGEDLTKFVYDHPFGLRKNNKVVSADYVTKEDGTGLVHTAPGHGQDDFNTGRKYNLEVLMPVDDRGVYTKDAAHYAGKHVLKANEEIIEELKSKGVLLAREDITHSYPHCWRCKKPIIFRATKQWFLKIDHDNLREKLKENINTKVKWFPAAGEERILSMVSSRPDWCLSRQRYWGVPIPALNCEGCGEYRLFTEVIEHFANTVKTEGTNGWFDKDISQLIPPGFKCSHCGKNQFKKTFDILDVWFDSGVSHQAVIKDRLNRDIPTEMYLEGSDQHRGWFQSSLIPAVAMEGKAPFANVLTHGFVVDGQGRKMSKSLGNVVAPQDIIKNSGAEVLRLWVASSLYNEDIRVSKEILERLVDAYRKIRNTIRYILGNLHGFEPQNQLPYEQILPLDRWALYRLADTVTQVRASYDQYEFAKVYKLIYSFCNEDLSSFYLDILKDRLYTSATLSPERRSAQTVLYQILKFLLKAMAPILSFTSEEAFAIMVKDKDDQKNESIHLAAWDEIPKAWLNEDLREEFQLLVDIRPHVLKALDEKRRAGDIGSSLEAKVIFETASERDWNYLNQHKNILAAVFIVSQVELNKTSAVAQGLGEAFSKTTVHIMKADGEKCSRCWNYKTDVGQVKDHPTLCGRCSTIVKEFI